MFVETTVHSDTSGEDLHTEPSSKLFKYDKPVTKGSWDPLDTPYYQPTNRIDNRTIEPGEPQELQMCMVSDVQHMDLCVCMDRLLDA